MQAGFRIPCFIGIFYEVTKKIEFFGFKFFDQLLKIGLMKIGIQPFFYIAPLNCKALSVSFISRA